MYPEFDLEHACDSDLDAKPCLDFEVSLDNKFNLELTYILTFALTCILMLTLTVTFVGFVIFVVFLL